MMPSYYQYEGIMNESSYAILFQKAIVLLGKKREANYTK